jgi:hypothetical protein
MKVDTIVTERSWGATPDRDKAKDNGRDNRAFSRIRIAQPAEEEDLVRICRQLHEENGSKYFSLSEAKVRANLQRAFNKQRAMIPVIGDPGKIEAIAYLSIEQFAWSDDWHISEWFNYVLPEHRQSRHARELLIWERNAAENLKCILWIGVTSEVRLAAKLRLYRRVFGNKLTMANGRPIPRDFDFDIDHFLLSCGCGGCYFVYKPQSMLSS